MPFSPPIKKPVDGSQTSVPDDMRTGVHTFKRDNFNYNLTKLTFSSRNVRTAVLTFKRVNFNMEVAITTLEW